MKINKYILEMTVFICGAVVMIFELVGSRILAPYLGTSIFVWTSLIGIILGSLSVGYYWGGKIADKKVTFGGLAGIIFLAAFFIGLTALLKDVLILFLITSLPQIKVTSVLSSIILFSPASILLGMVSPYVAKLKLNSLASAGATVGNLYAVSTAGSIGGTFLAGFYLIPSFGVNKILIALAIIILLISVFLDKKRFFKVKFILLVALCLGSFSENGLYYFFGKKNFVDINTAYSRIWIYDDFDSKTKKEARYLMMNNVMNSGMFLESDELVFDYLKYYHLAKHFKPDFKKTLMLGGAAYAFPKDFLLKYPEASMDVVEIDPMVTELAKKYFRLADNPQLNIYHEDGRMYLNRTQEKYDVIFGDAFSSYYSIPHQLTTQEAVRKNYEILNDDGMVILNIISAIDGEKGKFLRAQYQTYKSIFPQVYLFLVGSATDGGEFQNIMIVALKSNKVASLTSSDQEINEYLAHLWKKPIPKDLPILTDDYVPVDYYLHQAI
ncbi:MAG: Spermine synthase [Candidatus Moranbacteria bacterium GW2011_GWF1_34_10]|nr:MAG: Spermine synthase [Candidatus Moranbacteria bacterium GW2011_GWF1_34_10]